MALLFWDGFDHYTTAEITQKWWALGYGGGSSTHTSGIGPYGRRSTPGCRIRFSTPGINNGSQLLIKQFLGPGNVVQTSGNVCICGFAFQQVTAFTTLITGQNSVLWAVRKALTDNVTQCFLRLNRDGTISAMRDTTVLGTTTVALVQGVYNYLEVKVVIDNVNGSVVLRLNNTEILNVPTVDTQMAPTAVWDEICFGSLICPPGPTYECWLDDVYVCDGTGDAPTNTFLGPVQADSHLATLEGDFAEWTPQNEAGMRVNVVSNVAWDGGLGVGRSSPATAHATGNLLVAIIGGYATGGQAVFSVTDTAGNTYTKVDHVFEAADQYREEVWYTHNITGHAANVVTATWNANLGYRGIVVIQYAGQMVSPLDGSAKGTTASGGLSVTTGTLTTTQARTVHLMIPRWGNGHGGNQTFPAGFLPVTTDETGHMVVQERSVVGTPFVGTYTLTYQTAAVGKLALVVAFAFNTPPPSENYETVDDVVPDVETYVEASVGGKTDTYIMEDLKNTGKLIFGVQLGVSAKKENIGPYSLSGIVRQSGANHATPVLNPGATYIYRFVRYVINPATGLPWTEAEFNAAQFGFTRPS